MIVVSLITKTNGEIKKFFNDLHKSNQDVDNNVMEWIYVYKNVAQATKVLDLYINKLVKYDITLWLQINDGDLTPVKLQNYSKIIKELKGIDTGTNNIVNSGDVLGL